MRGTERVGEVRVLVLMGGTTVDKRTATDKTLSLVEREEENSNGKDIKRGWVYGPFILSTNIEYL